IHTLKEITTRRYQTITGIDQFVGKIREVLTKKGLAKNTIIVFTSDHGIMEGEWGLGGKALNYEACLKVPFIIYDPTLPLKKNTKAVHQFVQTIDLAPSFLNWAGVEIPATMQGRPLQLLLSGDTLNWRSAVLGENLWSTVFGNPRIESVRKGRWKYIRYFRNDFGGPQKGKNPYAVSSKDAELYRQFLTASIEGEAPVYEELFDLKSDPLENVNLAEVPENNETINEMRVLCKQLIMNASGQPDVLPYTTDLIQNWKVN
ncbi:MAG: sulfatase/phosphatase domain-containing protein, partial [Bacteroidota bacterium]